MKPLNRPMFRYGGPIKEGVMSGIREPKKDGNIVGGHQSPKLAGAHPLKDASGREHHFIPAFLGLNALRTGAMALGRRAIPKVANFFRTKTGEIGAGSAKVRTLPPMTPGRNLSKNIKTVPKQGPGQPIYEPNYLGRDPLVRAAGGLYNTVTSPTAKGIGAKAVRFATSPSSIIAGTAYYLWPDGKERTTPPPLGDSGRVGTSGAPGGGDPGMFSTPKIKDGEQDPSLSTKSEEELRKESVQRYRDIMDIKGMNKTAAYNSLIAASQLINQEGDFKGSIKDGSLINKIIGAANKQFEKPRATKDAINTLIAKAEIEKDINKEKNALENKKTNLQIKAAEKALAGDSFDEAILKSITGTSGKMPTGSKLAGILKATKGIDSVVLDGSQVTPGGEVKFLQESVNEKIKEGTSVNPGAYVLNTKILIVDEQGNVSQYY
jgi:hypothetical protein